MAEPGHPDSDDVEPELAEPEEAEPAPDPPRADAAAEGLSLGGIMDALRQAKVGELLFSTVSTLASVAYGKLEMNDLAEAKTAIDAIAALLPVLRGAFEDALVRDLEQALANLQLAYADAVSKSQ